MEPKKAPIWLIVLAVVIVAGIAALSYSYGKWVQKRTATTANSTQAAVNLGLLPVAADSIVAEGKIYQLDGKTIGIKQANGRTGTFALSPATYVVKHAGVATVPLKSGDQIKVVGRINAAGVTVAQYIQAYRFQ